MKLTNEQRHEVILELRVVLKECSDYEEYGKAVMDWIEGVEADYIKELRTKLAKAREAL